jgi:hypothetical protein
VRVLANISLFFGTYHFTRGIAVDPSKIKDVLSWSTPQNVSDIQSFLGLVGFYNRFIEGFSRITKPMTKLLEEDKIFEWFARCEASF